jgi:class 3 adenylate cyclase/predicted ATPase
MSTMQPDLAAAREGAAPRHRHYATVLFADLSNSTGISERLEAEDFAELLAAMRDVFQRVLPRHGGTIVRIDGDGVAAIFGYPQAHEDDGRRAVEAALDMRDGIRALSQHAHAGLPIQLHIGINSGLVLLEAGDIVRGRFEMLGDATNLAARLADCARADEIVVSEATLGRDRHLFETSGPERVAVRGRAEPVAVLQVRGRAVATTRFDAWIRRGRTPLVGRDAELARLSALLDTASQSSTLVALVGTPGVGKSRLADEFLARARDSGAEVLQVDCGGYLEAVSEPFERLARALIGREGGPAPDKLPLEDQADLIARRAADRPLICYVDDWHLAGETAHQALQALRRTARAGLMIIIGARNVDAADPSLKGAEILRLQPLTFDEAEPAIRALLTQSDPFLLRRVHQYAGGNPLFMEELCHAIGVSTEEAGWASHAWLDNLVQARFRRLPEAEAAIVRIAAVIGTIVPVPLLEAMAGERISEAQLRALADADFIYPSGSAEVLRFKHGLTRDIVYEAVGLHQRRALHRRIAEELVSGHALDTPPLDALAYHFRAAGDHERGARFAEEAGDAARSQSALDRAQDRYRDALDCLQRLDPTPEREAAWERIVQKLGLAAIFDPSAAHLPIFRQAAERAAARGDRLAVAWAEHRLAYVNLARGDRKAAIRHAGIALENATVAEDPGMAERVRETLGQALACAARYDEALPLLDAAIRTRRREANRQPPTVLAYSLAAKGFALADLGRFADAEACFVEARDRIDGMRLEVEGSVLSMRSAALLWQGRDAEAYRYAEEAAAITERVRARSTYAMCRALSGYAHWLLTGDEDALAAFADAANWLRAGADERQYASICYGWLAETSALLGRDADVRRYAALALHRARMQDHLGEPAAYRALARWSSRHAGRRSVAHYLARAGQAAARRRSGHEQAANLRCAGELARGDAAAALLAQAEAAFKSLGMRWRPTPPAAASRGPASAA